MQNLFFVAAGGALGASLRYAVGLAAARLVGTTFPWGTLIVNLAGCFAMGFVGQWLLQIEPKIALGSGGPVGLSTEAAAVAAQAKAVRYLLAVGFLGGLTTFSSFGWDTLRALESGRLSVAIANVAANVCLSLLAVWAGASLLRAAS
jgi:fluoride exporter